MAYFKRFKEGTMTITEKRSDPIEKGTTFDIHKPLIGPYALEVPRPDNSLHPTWWSSEFPYELSNMGSTEDVEMISTPRALTLQSSHHDRSVDVVDQFQLLGHKMQSQEAKWNASFKLVGDLSFVNGYWEWSEDILGRHRDFLKKMRLYDAIYASLFSYDRHGNVLKAFLESWCPSTNTLHTSIGELSISLWDLCKIGGLPFDGKFYDEVVPSAEEFSKIGGDGKPLLPPSCRYLFLAFHRLCKRDKGEPFVRIRDWVTFWFKGPAKYKKPPGKKTRNKTQRPRETHNPNGIIGPVQKRSSQGEEVFAHLGVGKEAQEKTYLAAFLACWLNRFVLPAAPGGMIRPGVFKIASMMAYGDKFCLSVPVLASIYQGLNEIASSSEPGSATIVFPIHYVYGWLGEYFKTHFHSDIQLSPYMVKYSGEASAKNFEESEAQSLIKSCGGVVMHHLAMELQQRRLLVNDDKISIPDFEYFANLRSGYLTLRRGGTHVIEPYNPHRFSRHFGFHQDLPGKLKHDIRTGSLADVLKFWISFTRYETRSSIVIPECTNLKYFSVTKDYVAWWSKVHKDSYIEKLKASGRNKRPASPNGKPNKCKRGMIDEHMTNESVKQTSDAASESRTGENVPLNLPRRPRTMVSRIEGMRGDDDRNWKHAVNDVDHTSSTENVLPDFADYFDGVPSGLTPFQITNQKVNDDEMMAKEANLAVKYFAGEESVQGPSSLELAIRKGSTPYSLADATSSLQSPARTLVDPHPNDSSAGHGTQGQARGKTTVENAIPQVNIQESHQATFSEAPTYDVKNTIVGIRRQSALALGNTLKRMLKRTEFSKAPFLRSRVRELFDEISSLPVDCSEFQERVDSYLQSAEEYNDVKSRYAQALTEEVHSQRLAHIDSRLNEALSSDSADVAHIQKLQADLLNDKRELEILLVRIEEREASILEANSRISQRKDVIASIKKEKNAIEEIPIIRDCDRGVVNTLEKLLKKEQDEILELSWLS